MSKAFVKENDDEDELDDAPQPQQGGKNYMTPRGYARLKEEFDRLWKVERPEVVKIVSWAASNGDRSENGDYIYGKRRLREIDRRLRFLSRRLDNAEIIDPERRGECDQVFFGATVTVCNQHGEEHTYSIVGIDEAEPGRGWISWISPLARCLLKAHEGDVVSLQTPGGLDELEVVEIRYEAL
ncbi:transcription elongation factor GreB [Betaproteobacteria bacterium PRO4]|uniref:transcription elongation factor GreB n=1 Tax=Nitrosomonas sp. TaxID=42353 RepID=UPI00256B8C93|nr:transcription elongation factor GreB [Nitrosomonas sp.]MDL1867303.1 transcription elongation factor GreB [Betaproteobacteria bacterium PRO4]